jgi:single-strand DNA-binding protein
MANLNKVMLMGNVTRDPELKYTPKGTAVTDVGLAINRNYTNPAGEKVEETVFVDVEIWGRTAEIAGEYAKKGRPILIEGRLRLDSWEDKQTGAKRSRLKVVCENLQLLGGRPGSSGGGGASVHPADEESGPPRTSSRPSPASHDEPSRAPEDDDIPF